MAVNCTTEEEKEEPGISGRATVKPVCFHALCKVPQGVSDLPRNLKQGKVISRTPRVCLRRLLNDPAASLRTSAPCFLVCCPRVEVGAQHLTLIHEAVNV